MIQIYYNKEQQKIPIKSWVTDLEYGALDQAKNLSNLPFVFKHIALMPDSHQGFGMPIGGVMANQFDLVKILIKLEPLGVIKG